MARTCGGGAGFGYGTGESGRCDRGGPKVDTAGKGVCWRKARDRSGCVPGETIPVGLSAAYGGVEAGRREAGES